MAKLTEVFRMVPKEGKYYKTAKYTEKRNNKYYTSNELQYVGKYIKHVAGGGYGDNQEHYALFEKEGVENYLQYDYDGMTCFVEVEQIMINPFMKDELLQKVKDKPISSLQSLCKEQLSTEETRIIRDFNL
jgi:hypothetical protein